MCRTGSFAPIVLILAASVTPLFAQQGTTATSAFGGANNRTLGQGVSAPLPTGITGSPGSMVESLNTDAGQVTGNERFIQDNRQAGAFVGADTAEVGANNVFSQQGAGGQRGGGALGGLRGGQFGNQFSQFNFNQPGQAGRGGQLQTQRRALRTPIRVAFPVPQRDTASALARFRASISRTPLVRLAGSVSVTFEGSTAVLRGVVDSEQRRDLLTRIARMEPGISGVRNELVVQTVTPAASPASTLSQPAAR